MIKIQNTDVHGWEAAIRGMRNPMNSWGDTDSRYGWHTDFVIGEKDLKLMQNLIKPGTGDHRKYLRYIDVWVDFEAPLYWWKEFDTYRMGVTPDPAEIEMNSCSTMHKIHAKKFDFCDFSHENLSLMGKSCLENTINCLNNARELYLETKEKSHWWDMIQLLPTSYNQRRTIKLNYEVLRNMYFARRFHKLDEWRKVCEWIESLPYAKELICWEG